MKDGFLRFKVSWYPRVDGSVPKESFFSSEQLREHDPHFLLDFYESKIVLCSKKNAHRNGNQDSTPPPENLIQIDEDSHKGSIKGADSPSSDKKDKEDPKTAIDQAVNGEVNNENADPNEIIVPIVEIQRGEKEKMVIEDPLMQTEPNSIISFNAPQSECGIIDPPL